MRHDLGVERRLRAAEPVHNATAGRHRRRIAGLLKRVEAAEHDLLERVRPVGPLLLPAALPALADVLHDLAKIVEIPEGGGELARRVVGAVDKRGLAVQFADVGPQHAHELRLDHERSETVVLPVQLDERLALDQRPLGGVADRRIDPGVGHHLVQFGARHPAHGAPRLVAAAVELDLVAKLHRREQHRGEIVDVRERLGERGRVPVLVAGQIEVAVERPALDALLDVRQARLDDLGGPWANLLARDVHGRDDSRSA